jgi:putative peptidoglycan binding protein
MKAHKVLFLALVVSAALAVSVEASDRRGNNGKSQVAPSRGHSSGSSFSSGSGFRNGSGRMIGPTQRFSSMGVRSMPTSFRQRSTFSSGGNVGSIGQRRFTPETFNRNNGFARFQNNGNFGTIQGNRVNRFGSLGNPRRGLNSTVAGNSFTRFGNNKSFGAIQGNPRGRFGNNNRGFNGSGANNHVFARRSADWHRGWDHDHDHWWNGHRCRFVNGSWFIFDLGFFPGYGYPYDYYGYDYYPSDYSYYSYPYSYGYDSGVYEGADPNYYDQGNYDSSDQNADSTVAAAQERLARQGYYRGEIDGVFGPATRRAIMRYQSDNGLRVTGYLTMDTRQSLGLRQGARY